MDFFTLDYFLVYFGWIFLLLSKTKCSHGTVFLLTLQAVFLYFPLAALAHKPVPKKMIHRHFLEDN